MKKILFAFGTHGTETRPPNREFFRETVSPFLEEIASSDRRGIIIHEAVIPPKLDFRRFKKTVGSLMSDRSSRLIKCIQERLRSEISNVLDVMSVTADVGRAIPYQNFDIGYEDKMLEINSRKPRTLINIIEPQAVHVSLAVAHDELASRERFLCQGSIGHLVEALDVRVKNIVFRDALMVRLIGEMLERHPEFAIIVPRGTAHSDLANLVKKKLGLPGDEVLAYKEGAFDDGCLYLDEITQAAVEDANDRVLGLRMLAFYSLKWMYFMHLESEGLVMDRKTLRAVNGEANSFADENLDWAMDRLPRV